MNLLSLEFIVFVCALLVAYYAAGRLCPKWQWLTILVFNLLFYALAGSILMFALVVLIAGITWAGSVAFVRIDDACKQARKQASSRAEKKELRAAYNRKRQVLFWSLLTVCLLVLGYFKYWNVLLFHLGLEPQTDSLGIVLPLGISFYTFQAIGYLIDTYNAKYEPATNFGQYLLFVSYFPQIIQGPINKYANLAPQLTAHHTLDMGQMRRGLLRVGLGVLKVSAIANVLAASVGNIMLAAESGASGALSLYGVFLYSIQLYGNFSGGIDIVEGVSELLGIEMDTNFRQPYFSTSLADFWRRWHMSLGAFMRDYVFYPLAVTKPMRRFSKWTRSRLGKKVGRTIPAGVANIIVFTLVGVWHGIELHYVAWGLYNGFVIAAADLCGPLFDRMCERLHINRESAPYTAFAIVRTIFVVLIGRFFDYYDSVALSLVGIRSVFTNFMPGSFLEAVAHADTQWGKFFGMPPVALVACIVLLVIDVAYERGVDVRSYILNKRFVWRALLYVAFIVLIAASFGFDTTLGEGRFLYANF